MREYYKIGEISRLFHISTDTLRYYESIGLLKPTRTENNYRFYRTAEIWKLNVIRDLRDLGFSMEVIKEYLENRSIDSTLAIIDQELQTIEDKMQRLTQIKENLHLRRESILAARAQPTGQIEQVFLPDRHCHRILQGYETDAQMDLLMKKLINFDQQQLYIIGSNQIGSFLELADIDRKEYQHYRSVFVLHQNGEHCIPAGEYLTVTYHGDCSQNSIYIPRLLCWAKDHALCPTGPVVEVSWVDIHTSSRMAEQIIQLQVRVTRTSTESA